MSIALSMNDLEGKNDTKDTKDTNDKKEKISDKKREDESNEPGNRGSSIALSMNDLEEKKDTKDTNDKKEKISNKKGHVSDKAVVAHDVAQSRAIELRVTRLAACLFPEETIVASEISTIVLEAVKASDENYGELEAVEWANGFVFPSNIGLRDSLRLAELGGNIAAMAKERHGVMTGEGRLSNESIERTILFRSRLRTSAWSCCGNPNNNG